MNFVINAGGGFIQMEIETLEELIAFIEKNGGRIVIEKAPPYSEEWTIEIYRGYRE